MKRSSLLVLGFTPFSLFAQYNPGPRITSLGMTGVVVQDVWNLNANQAGIANQKEAVTSVSFERRFLNPDLDTKSAVVVYPYKQNAFGLSFQVYGFSAFKEQKVGVSYAKRFGNSIYTALNFNYHQIKIEQYGKSQTYSFEGGIQFRATDELLIGAHIANPNNSGYTKELNAVIPVKGEFGIAYQFSDKVQLNTAFVKILNSAADVRLGIEYSFIDWFSLRGGFSSNPFMQFGGFGLKYQKLGVDVAASYHPTLGYSPQVAFSYEF